MVRKEGVGRKELCSRTLHKPFCMQPQRLDHQSREGMLRMSRRDAFLCLSAGEPAQECPFPPVLSLGHLPVSFVLITHENRTVLGGTEMVTV